MVKQLAEMPIKTSAHAVATIFFADENIEQCRDEITALSEAGYIVIKIVDGHQLLTLLNGFTPDCIILSSTIPYHESSLDVAMPSTPALLPTNGTEPGHFSASGFALCYRLTQNPQLATVPILLTGPDHSVAARMNSLRAKAWDCLPKPLQSAELILRVEHHLEIANRISSAQEEQMRIAQEAAQNATALQEERKQRRQSEQKSALLLDTLYAQNQQLQLLTASLLSGAESFPTVAAGRKQLVQEQLTLVQTYLERLHLLTAKLNEINGTIGALATQPLRQAIDQKRLALTSEQARATEPARRPAHQAHSPNPSELSHLSEREYEVLVRLASGESYQQIADAFQVSSSTIRSYRSRIMQKLRLNSSTQMIKFAVRHGLVKV